jgi:hypothetical protein
MISSQNLVAMVKRGQWTTARSILGAVVVAFIAFRIANSFMQEHESLMVKFMGQSRTRHSVDANIFDHFAPDRWKELVRHQAGKDNTITLTMMDQKYKHFGAPWYKQALRLGINNAVIIALDPPAYERAVSDDLPVINYMCLVNNCTEFSPASESAKYHFKISSLRVLMDLGYHILMTEMDIILTKNPFTTTIDIDNKVQADHGSTNLSLLSFGENGLDMWLSTHCSHPRVNIGFVTIQNNQRTRAFFRLYERNWQTARAWDQTLWDSMLPNFDQLQALHVIPNETVTWGIISPRYVTEWGKDVGFQHGKCTSTLTTVPCEQVVTYHLTSLSLLEKQAVMCYFYRMGDCDIASKQVTDVLDGMCHVRSKLPF